MWFKGLVQFVVLFVSGEIILQAQILNVPILPGEMQLRGTKPAAVKRHELRMGVRISGDYDDNAFHDVQSNGANLLTVVEPHVGWSVSSDRAEWTLDYHPGFTMSPGLSIYDSRSHFLDTSAQLMLTKRLKVRLRDSFLESKNAFDRMQEFELGRGSSVLDRPNVSIVNTPEMQNQQAGVDLIYALSSRAIAGVSGALYRVRYSSLGTVPQSAQAASISGHAVYSRHFTRHQWIGLDYNIQDLTSQTSKTRSLLQSLFYTDTILIAPNMTISLFVGPEHSTTSNEYVAAHSQSGMTSASQTSWHWAGGSDLAWTGARTSLAASFSHRISDGGGLQGIVHVSTLTAELQRHLTHQWNAGFVVSYVHDTALSTTSAAALSYASAAVEVTRALSPRCSLKVQYWRVHELSSGSELRPYLADHNRISTSLVYDFKRPLWSSQR